MWSMVSVLHMCGIITLAAKRRRKGMVIILCVCVCLSVCLFANFWENYEHWRLKRATGNYIQVIIQQSIDLIVKFII